MKNTNENNPSSEGAHSELSINKVIAIVVSFNPLEEELQDLLLSVTPQVWHVLIVDNGSNSDIAQLIPRGLDTRITCLYLGENYGIATALNKGVAWARENAASHIVFFDQDSIPGSDMIGQLIAANQKLEAEGIKVAAIGACFLDPRANNPPPFIRVRGGRLIRMRQKNNEEVVEVDYLITSGSLLPLASFDHVGPMEDKLFIDYVDIEWCLRAKNKGFRSFGVYPAKMQHSLGNAPLVIAGKKLPIHSPWRHYYHFRNAVWLCKKPWIPTQWKFVNTYRLLGKVIIYSLFASPRLTHFRMIFKGIWDGLNSHMGNAPKNNL